MWPLVRMLDKQRRRGGLASTHRGSHTSPMIKNRPHLRFMFHSSLMSTKFCDFFLSDNKTGENYFIRKSCD